MELGNTSLVPSPPSPNLLIPNSPPRAEPRVLCPRTRCGHDLDTTSWRVGESPPRSRPVWRRNFRSGKLETRGTTAWPAAKPVLPTDCFGQRFQPMRERWSLRRVRAGRVSLPPLRHRQDHNALAVCGARRIGPIARRLILALTAAQRTFAATAVWVEGRHRAASFP
jgi:hypothetical protein